MNISSRVIYSILFFSLLLVLLFISKPSVMFDEDGSLKDFGIGTDKTMFSFGVFTVVLAIISFYIFTLLDIIFKKNNNIQYQ